MNSNWSRWIIASIAKHFDDGKGTYDFYIEGAPFDKEDAKAWVELRLGGPDVKEQTKDQFKIQVTVNLLGAVVATERVYEIHDLVGHFSALCTIIPVYKYGDGAAHLGCLQPTSGVSVLHWGLTDDDRLNQATVSLTYRMLLEGDS